MGGNRWEGAGRYGAGSAAVGRLATKLSGRTATITCFDTTERLLLLLNSHLSRMNARSANAGCFRASKTLSFAVIIVVVQRIKGRAEAR